MASNIPTSALSFMQHHAYVLETSYSKIVLKIFTPKLGLTLGQIGKPVHTLFCFLVAVFDLMLETFVSNQVQIVVTLEFRLKCFGHQGCDPILVLIFRYTVVEIILCMLMPSQVSRLSDIMEW